MEISVLTLNCWSIPMVSKDVKMRIRHIGEMLASGRYDIAVLQEVWTQESYDVLVKLATPTMMYTHYFHSGLYGSGCCLFSKHKIQSTLIHRYSLNGYPYKVLHMDWYGGKAIGLCQLNIDGLTVNVYATHIHARYCYADEDYKVHRIMQAHEMAEFINQTQYTSDLIIACGDLNMRPCDLGYKVIVDRANLKDAWLEAHGEESVSGMTSDRPDNVYCINSEHSYGIRIDHILYRPVTDCTVDVVQSGLGPRTFKPSSNSEPMHYSDHEALTATLSVTRPEKNNIVKRVPKQLNIETLQDIKEILQLGSQDVRQTLIISTVALCLVLVLLFIIMTADPLVYILPSYIVPGGYLMLEVILGLALIFIYWNLLVMCPSEANALQGCMADIQHQIDSHSMDEGN